MSCFEFLMRHSRFWDNQIYKPSHVFNKSWNQVLIKYILANTSKNSKKSNFAKPQ